MKLPNSLHPQTNFIYNEVKSINTLSSSFLVSTAREGNKTSALVDLHKKTKHF